MHLKELRPEPTGTRRCFRACVLHSSIRPVSVGTVCPAIILKATQMLLWHSVLVFCRAERYFCRTRGRNRGESISAIVSAISAGEKWQKSSKPDKIVLD